MDVVKLAAKAHVAQKSMLATAIATTTTITVDATGTRATVVAQKDLNSAKNAHAKTVTTSLRVTSASRKSTERVKSQHGRETGIAMTRTTTPVATGMEEIAADTRTTTNIATNASAWTAHTSSKAMHALKRLRVPVAQRTSSVMASATTKTTMPVVPGMTAIAVVAVARANSTNTVKNVAVWIASTNLRVTNVSLQCQALVPSQPGRATVTVMTKTTMLVVLGTEETVADPITTNTARYASAATVRLQPNPMNVHLTSKVLARPQNFRETAFVTTETITQAVIGTRVTAVVSVAIRNKPSIAKNANVWIVLSRQRQMSALARRSRANVGTHTSVMECAMM